jgi:hypothetical protein
VKNNFYIADLPLARGRHFRRAGHIEPFDVLYGSTLVAHKVVMTVQVRVIPRRFSFRWNFPDKAGPCQVSQAVINGGARNARVGSVQRLENFIRSRVNRAADKIVKHIMTLGRDAEPYPPEMLVQVGLLGDHNFRLSLILDCVKISRGKHLTQVLQQFACPNSGGP